MRRLTLALCLLAVSSPALAQQAGEDWDLTTNADQQLSLATLDFGANVLALRCRAGELDLLLTGVPVSTGETRKARVSIGAIGAEDQLWTAQTGQPVLGADEPARLARQLRAGGELDVRLDPEDAADRPRRYRLPVPASRASVNAVLTACGQPLEEPRDLIARSAAGFLPTWVAAPQVQYPSEPGAGTVQNAMVRVSCLVGPEWGLQDCRADMERPSGFGFGDKAVAAAAQSTISPPADGVDLRGRLIRFTIRFETAPS